MKYFIDRMADSFAMLGGIVLAIVVLITTTNAFGFIADRIAGVFGKDVPGLSGYEDVVRLAISAAALLFFPFCQLNRGHVAVDLFVRGCRYPVRRALDRLWLALICGTAWFLAYWMVFGLLEKRSDNALAGVISWVEWPFYIPGILSLILWGCVALSQMFGDADNV